MYIPTSDLNMAILECPDIHHLPCPPEESPPLTLWAKEQNRYLDTYRQYGVRATNISGDDFGGYNGFHDHGIASVQPVQPMQRFLHDPSPLTAGLLRAKLDPGVAFDTQYPTCYERSWPFAEYLRNDSPERTSVSGSSSYATQNDVYKGSCNSPSEFASPFSIEALDGFHHLDHTLHGGNISLREVEYEHSNLEPAMEENDHDDDVKLIYAQEPVSATETCAVSRRDAESVEPEPMSREDEASDSDYSPGTKSKSRRRSTASSSGSGRNGTRRRNYRRKHCNSSPTLSKVTKKGRGPRESSSAVAQGGKTEAQRYFPCPLAIYGCSSTFGSKNEWKRHVSTQHIKLGFWRCDLCTTTVDPSDEATVYHNDFNRKDLFSQHLRRMHLAPANNKVTDNRDNLAEHQARCYRVLRTPPNESACLFCDRAFSGPNSWDDRMEHLGRHFEKDRMFKPGAELLDSKAWMRDEKLEHYLLDEGLVERTTDGKWRIGDGKSKRVAERDDVD